MNKTSNLSLCLGLCNFLCLLILFLPAQAQRGCATNNDPASFSQAELNRLTNFNNYVNSLPSSNPGRVRPVGPSVFSQRITSEPVWLIPVVVNVVHNTDVQNISDAQIRSQIDVLNEDFRRTNQDASQTPAVFSAEDTRMQFYLACQDPNGVATTGIRRFRTNQVGFTTANFNQVKQAGIGLTSWNPNQYLNIWSCNFNDPLIDVLGVATSPSSFADSPGLDGVVINHEAFGRSTGTVEAPFDLGRTVTHEVGHWLNLIHIWGPRDSNPACTGSDEVADTPTQRAPTAGCTHTSTPCTPNVPIMFMNYMDYTDDRCMNAFTFGQKVRMRANFDPNQPRSAFQKQEYSISGPAILGTYQIIRDRMSVVFPERTYTLNGNLPTGATTTWAVGPGVTIIRSTNSSVTVRGTTNVAFTHIQARINNAGPCGNVTIAPFQLAVYGDPVVLNVSPPDNVPTCSVPTNACYTVEVQKTGQRLQATGNNTILQQGANGQNNQIWKVDDRGNGRVSFTVQDGTNRSIRAVNGSYDEWLTLASYAANGQHDWTLGCNPADNTLWRVSYPSNNNTWDIREFGNQSELQLWGNTSDPFYDYRSFRFQPATCPTTTPPPPPPPVGNLAFQTVGYNCNTGVWQWQYTGGNGSSIETWCPGAFGNRLVSMNNVQSVTLEGHQRNGTTFNVSAVQSGQTFTYTFTSSCNGGTTPPPPPPPSGALGILAPTFTCGTGELTINTTGGNGSAIDYQIPGLRGWGSNPTMIVPSWQRNGTTFTLQARQSGVEAAPYTFLTNCGSGRLAAISDAESTELLRVSPNPTTGQARVRYYLAAGKQATLSVESTAGKTVYSLPVKGADGPQEVDLNLGQQATGIYLVRLKNDTVNQTVKLLLQR
ncbi:MAG: T9SS C-terminal target domain-containing protein [Cytophagales bacterium]|nr:MAG: T9SS C-terminal target domain-containing protein [Cytophagales bacterium]